jgi:hypothetical protein
LCVKETKRGLEQIFNLIIFPTPLTLNIQLPPTVTLQTFGKMAEPMCTLSLLNQLFNKRIAEKSAAPFPGPGFYHVAVRAGRRACGPKNQFSMRIFDPADRNGR